MARIRLHPFHRILDPSEDATDIHTQMSRLFVIRQPSIRLPKTEGVKRTEIKIDAA